MAPLPFNLKESQLQPQRSTQPIEKQNPRSPASLLMKAGSRDHVGRFQVSVALIFTNSFSETPSDPCRVPDPQADPVHPNTAAPPKLGQEAI